MVQLTRVYDAGPQSPLSLVFVHGLGWHEPQLGDMTLHNAHLLTLAQTFLAQWALLGMPARVFAESKGVLLGRKLLGIALGRRVKVVQGISSEPHLPGEVALSLAEDHFSVAKP